MLKLYTQTISLILCTIYSLISTKVPYKRFKYKSKQHLNLTKAKVSYCRNSSLVKLHNRLPFVAYIISSFITEMT